MLKGVLCPLVNAAINDEDGNPCRIPLAQQQHWRRHFSAVLNQFDSAELKKKVVQCPVISDLAQSPTLQELTTALRKLKLFREGRQKLQNPPRDGESSV